MRFYELRYGEEAKCVGAVLDDVVHDKFQEHWQKKEFDEGLKYFPTKWKWMDGPDPQNEFLGDMPMVFFMGVVFIEEAFKKVSARFPVETKINHEFEIDGYKFVWVNPQLISMDDFENTKLNLVTAKPSYAKCVSQEFVDFCVEHSFTGARFVPL